MKTKRQLKTTAALPVDAILIELDKRHAAACERTCGKTTACEHEAAQRVSRAIAQSLIAFPAVSEAGLSAKFSILRREYSFLGTTEILSDRHGAKAVVAAILDDVFALA